MWYCIKMYMLVGVYVWFDKCGVVMQLLWVVNIVMGCVDCIIVFDCDVGMVMMLIYVNVIGVYWVDYVSVEFCDGKMGYVEDVLFGLLLFLLKLK